MAVGADRSIRVGLIGHGDAGASLHGPLIEAAANYRIVGVATSRPGSLSARRDRPRWERDPGRLIAADDVDLVVVATPNDSHHHYAREALLAGKAVVVEKPFVTSPSEARELIQLAHARGLLLTVFHNRRWDGDYLCLRDVVSSGVLGPLRRLEARWDRAPEQSPRGWRDGARPGAGIHWDLGPHLVDQMLQLFGDPSGAPGRSLRFDRPACAATGFELELTYPDGLTCAVSAEESITAARPRFSLIGARGSLTIDAPEACRTEAPDARLPLAELIVDGGRTTREIAPDRWDRFYPQLATALRGQGMPAVTADQAWRVVGVLFDLDRAAPRPERQPHPEVPPRFT